MKIQFFNKLGRTGRIYLSLVMILGVLLAVSGILVPGTLKPSHLLEVARQSVPLGITSLGQTFVILSGGIDLSVGEIITFTNIVGTDLMRGKNEVALPVILFLLFTGTLLGAISGLVIASTNMPPLVMTFGMASIVKGSYLLYSSGTPKGSVSPILRTMGAGRLGAIPISLLLFCLTFGIVLYISKRTIWGRSVFYLGNNPRAALYSGVPVRSRLVFAYAISGLMASMAGLILSGYIGIANFNIGGDAYNMNSVAAAVIGGNTFNGQGGLVGTALGALIVTVLTSLMTSLGIGQAGKSIMQGLVITMMVALYTSQSDIWQRMKQVARPERRDEHHASV
ncbi:MAG: ABC transporter permease [Firmicutes bacterium]|nr:ABC transporter permease [Bacillota bacterium]